MSFSDQKRQRDLQNARIAGDIAPAIDVKTSQTINPHNPEFLTKKPWYLAGDDNAGPTLEHQTKEQEQEVTLAAAERALEEQRKKLKQQVEEGVFQVGQWVEALKNNKPPYLICQIIKIDRSMHDLKFEDGFTERKVKYNPRAERPRIRMTKAGNRTISVAGKATYDSKRDAYHGYDNDSHNVKLSKKYDERDAIRAKLREQDKDDRGSDNSEDSDDEFVQRDEDAKVMTTRLARQGGVGGAQMKVTARNLRIREDTAKYLRNLDPNSAYYDPKSRSMRDNPNPEIAASASEFAGDNFARTNGDAISLAETQLFAWDAAEKGVEIHPQANPSQAELLKKQFKSKATELQLERKKAVLDKYGGAEHLDGTGGLAAAKPKESDDEKLDRKIRFGVQMTAEEYSRDGRLVKSSGVEVKQRPIASKYEEDIFQNGHTTVWGSYFHRGAYLWGYADDHSLMKNSYCTGENGRIANDEAYEMLYGTGHAGSAALAQARGMLKAIPAFKEGSTAPVDRSKFYGETSASSVVDPGKLREALRRADKEGTETGKKRKYNSMHGDVDMTEEDMEAYRLRKDRGSDPMANVGGDDLLEYK